MHLSNIILLSIASIAYAFQNSAPLLISSDRLIELPYISKFDSISDKIESFTQDICNDDNKALILTIDGLFNFDDVRITQFFKFSSKFTKHVIYKDETNSLLSIAKNCNVQDIDMNDDVKWLTSIINSNANIITIKLSNDIDELFNNLNKLSVVYPVDNIIVQTLPSFKNTNSLLNKATDSLTKQKQTKRHSVIDQDIDYDTLEKDLKDAFDEIEKLIQDESYTIQDDDKSTIYKNVSAPVPIDGSLFDKYGFFSNGIWMGTLVSLFLFSVLYIALGWLSSLQVSYKAFDKPFNANKKFQ
ncbi:hypothetical protein CANARDRAFT_28070 [[Candida] arabinofermentans NRRL YB-2248]|uniref:Protein BIG1 n=1 Tax=[Candida] arabinofermentans NRRL YB-2248 TaxID=983967 RepID=A0A1E4T2V5_9ASCO|nr:hypothetical protein CANARDRAFT_28070 [[Candida] arabinofermentans NRRL YB-2248]